MAKKIEKVAAKSAPKKKKVSQPKKVVGKPTVKLISFSVKATIPTQAYGNLMPEITVEADSIDEASNAVMPVIEEMFVKYMEDPRDGRLPKFLPKVTETEKKVDPMPNVARGPQTTVGDKLNPPVNQQPASAPVAPEQSKTVAGAPATAETTVAFQKAEVAVKTAASREALDLTETRIKESVKLNDQEKGSLYELILVRRKEFKA